MQEALIRRLGPNAHAFTIEIPSIAPPSVQLVPAKEYNGPPIGNSYDVRIYVGKWKKLADFLGLYFLGPDERMHFEQTKDNCAPQFEARYNYKRS